MIRILALDLSLTRTGYALADGTHGVLLPPYGPSAPIARLGWIRDSVKRLVILSRPDIVCIEGYSYGSQQEGAFTRAFATGELGGVVRLQLFDLKVSWVDVSPSSLKLFATGFGLAKKDAMIVAAVRELGYTGHDSNEADALWLRQMALAKYEPAPPPTFQLENEPRKGSKSLASQRKKALLGVEWPEVGVRVETTAAGVK